MIGLSDEDLEKLPPAKEAAKGYAKFLFKEKGTVQAYFLDGHVRDD